MIFKAKENMNNKQKWARIRAYFYLSNLCNYLFSKNFKAASLNTPGFSDNT